ncbi:hypothetical protein EV363DRAFT_1296076 [Boletus edulis]|nr:hypothetical protein EV363DRAFT_1296076 [Boletus edulis]
MLEHGNLINLIERYSNRPMSTIGDNFRVYTHTSLHTWVLYIVPPFFGIISQLVEPLVLNSQVFTWMRHKQLLVKIPQKTYAREAREDWRWHFGVTHLHTLWTAVCSTVQARWLGHAQSGSSVQHDNRSRGEQCNLRHIRTDLVTYLNEIGTIMKRSGRPPPSVKTLTSRTWLWRGRKPSCFQNCIPTAVLKRTTVLNAT